MGFSRILVFSVLASASHTSQLKQLPYMVVFDLDYVLWPHRVGITAIPPFHNNSAGEVIDDKGHAIRYYPEVPEVFKYLKEKKIFISICSNSTAHNESDTLLKLLELDDYIYSTLIFPDGRDLLFHELSLRTRIVLEDMLYFYNEVHNITQLTNIDVFPQKVKNGMTMKILMDGLKNFSDTKTSGPAPEPFRFKRLPKIVVFDLDQTLWPYWVGITAYPPFHKNGTGVVLDDKNRVMKYFPEVLTIFKRLRANNILIAVCSNNHAYRESKTLLNFFGWSKFFYRIEVEPAAKDDLLYRISLEGKIDLEEVIYFDDEVQYIIQMKNIHVFSYLVHNGITMKTLEDGMKAFSDFKTSHSAQEPFIFKRLPKMVVFDLDQTLWPFWVDTNAMPPFHKNSSGHVMDVNNTVITYYSQVPEILKYLEDNKILIGISASTFHADGSKQLLLLFGWTHYFHDMEMHDYGEESDIDKLSERNNISLDDILFFDHEPKYHPEKKIEVFTEEIKRGMSIQILMDGLKRFSDNKTSTGHSNS